MKKGFTLIELLAVIVILAIIALIATPIVLNIINDARESSTLRSVDFYLDALEYTIADAVLYNGGISNGTYQITVDGNLCTGTFTDGICEEGKELDVEVNGEKPSGGSITIENGNIKEVSVDLNDKTIVKTSSGELKFLDAVLITSIDFNYENCNNVSVNGTCVPVITIEPENATNKTLKFTMAETNTFAGKNCEPETGGQSSNYLSIEQTTGILTKIKSHKNDFGGNFYIDITVQTTDGSNLSVTKTIYYDSSYEQPICW